MTTESSKIETIAIDTASSGANTLVDISARVAAKMSGLSDFVKEKMRVYILSYQLVSAGAVTAKFVSGSTDMTGAMSLITGTPVGMCSGGCEQGKALIVCGVNEDLVLTLGGAVQVSGHIKYLIA